MKVVPDTSIWVDYLRGGPSGRGGHLDSLLDADTAIVAGPIVAELLAGTDGDRLEQLWTLLSGLPWAELDHEGWRVAGEVSGRLRAVGRSLPLTDVLIATCAVRAGAQVWSRDRDFDAIGEALPNLKRYRPPR
jgi:predicted nucleic acid-binding protein